MPRTRRPAEQSKRLILDAAAELLATGGVDAVQVRAVARRVGMTDAGVAHHFGSRDQLLEALVREGGRRLRRALESVLSAWVEDDATGVKALVDALAGVYRQGFAELAVSLHAAGWRDHSSGILDPVVDALHRRRRDPTTPKSTTRLAVAALHQAVALESIYGSAFRRSAGVRPARADDPTAQLRWWTSTIEGMLREG